MVQAFAGLLYVTLVKRQPRDMNLDDTVERKRIQKVRKKIGDGSIAPLRRIAIIGPDMTEIEHKPTGCAVGDLLKKFRHG